MARRNYTEQDDPLTYAIIGCAMKVHSKLGPALNEGVYDECMFTELSKARLEFRHHPAIRVPYDGKLLDRFYRPDFVIESQVILEVKAVEHVLPVHHAQVLSYMKLAEIEKGLLINFRVALLLHGIKRFIMTKAPIGAPDE